MQSKEKKLNICLVEDSFFPAIDGVIRVVDNYAKRLSKFANVTVIAPKYHKKGQEPVVPYKVLFCKSMPVFYNGYRIALPRFSFNFKKQLKKEKFDIIHLHSPLGVSRYMEKYAKKNNIPCVATIHTQFKLDFKNATKSDLITCFVMKRIINTFNKADEVWTLNENVKHKLYDYGFNDGPNRIMRNGTDFILPNNINEKSNSINLKYNLEENLPVFIFVGRITVTKNILFIVDALKIMKDSGLKFKMFFVGGGMDIPILENHIKKCNLTSDVILTGKILDKDIISSLLARADLFLFPSLYDMSSIVQIEAASHKLPCVFIKDSVTSAGIIDNENGFLSKNSPKDFALKVLNIIRDKNLLNYVSENCYKNVYKHWDTIIEEVYNGYNDIILDYKSQFNSEVKNAKSNNRKVKKFSNYKK